MPLGTEVGLDPRHIVLDGDPAPLTERGTAAPPLFGPSLLLPNGRPRTAELLLSYIMTSTHRVDLWRRDNLGSFNSVHFANSEFFYYSYLDIKIWHVKKTI